MTNLQDKKKVKVGIEAMSNEQRISGSSETARAFGDEIKSAQFRVPGNNPSKFVSKWFNVDKNKHTGGWTNMSGL